MEAKKTKRCVLAVPTAIMDDAVEAAKHGCQNCGKHIPTSERRRLRMVEHDVEPELCLTCQSDRQVKRQLGGVYVLRHEGPYNRAQRRRIARERA